MRSQPACSSQSSVDQSTLGHVVIRPHGPSRQGSFLSQVRSTRAAGLAGQQRYCMSNALSANASLKLLQALKARFERNMHRHESVAWAQVQAGLDRNQGAIVSLRAMESTGGEPDVIGQDKDTGRLTFCDCCAESPTGRRSLCDDRAALDSRKEHKPQGSAV